MKIMRTTLVTLITLTTLSINAQKKSGIVLYVESMDMTRAIDQMDARMDSAKQKNPESAARMDGFKSGLTDLLKSFESTKTELYFNGNQSVYKEREKQLTEDEVNDEQNMFMKFKPEMDKNFKSFNKEYQITTKDFMGKKFLIKDSIDKLPWKMTGKQREIGGFPCLQASYTDTTRTIEVWFTPQIPVSTGPKGLGGLPGLILEAKFIIPEKIKKETELSGMRGMRKMMSNSAFDMVIQAESIQFKELSDKEVEEPNKGELIKGQEKFDKIIKEKMEEMKEMGRGRGRF
jgi:GLPGLI family protein